MRIPFTWAKFYDLLKNNFVTLDTGEVVEVKDITWKNRKYSADITLAISDTSAFNVYTLKLV
jgi:hypothetical protein